MVTVITINYNNREGLQRTLDSVRKQSVHEFEYIIVDGGSTDGSRELIEENRDIITEWVSEKDNGIYNAMNKGVAMASGDYCLFLNSGDVFHDPEVMHKVNATPFDVDIVLGRVNNVAGGKIVEEYIPDENITLMHIFETGMHHAGSFIRTSLMEKYPYSEALKVCSDREFFIRTIIDDNCSYRTLPFVVCDFEVGGASADKCLLKQESLAIINSLYPPRLMDDFTASTLRIKEMTLQLVDCRGKIIKFICGLNILILKLFKLILGSKMYVEPSMRNRKN